MAAVEPFAYTETRSETDRNLIQEVRQLLIDAGLGHYVPDNYDNHHLIRSGMDKVPDVQRWFLNKYWHLQLMSADAISVNERFCLIPNGSIDEWLDLFKKEVLPFVVRHSLPINLSGHPHG